MEEDEIGSPQVFPKRHEAWRRDLVESSMVGASTVMLGKEGAGMSET